MPSGREVGPADAAAVDALYAAAAGEIGWAAAAAALAAMVGARSATIWAGDPTAGQFDLTATHAIADEAVVAFQAHWHRYEPWMIAGSPALIGRVHHSAAMVPEDALRRSAYFNEFARPLGIHQLLGGWVEAGRGLSLGFGLHRPFDRDRFTEAERRRVSALLPHMRRAVQLHRRLARGGALAAPEAAIGLAVLDHLAQAVVVAQANGRVVHANAAAEAMGAAGRWIRLAPRGQGGTVSAADPASAEALRRAIADAAQGGAGGALLLPGGEAEALPPAAAIIAPLPRRFAGPGPADLALLMLRPLAPPDFDSALLARLFGLSPAEAEVAVALLQGATAEAVAAQRGVRVGTVRGQVRIVLEKTGAGSLRGLAVALGGLGSIAPG